MKAQEKAQELIGNFYAIQDTIGWTNDGELINELNEWNETNKKEAEKYWLILATKSAYILAHNTFKALIDLHKCLDLDIQEQIVYDEHVFYWEEVRGELKKEVKKIDNNK
jgi:hypothetical protein